MSKNQTQTNTQAHIQNVNHISNDSSTEPDEYLNTYKNANSSEALSQYTSKQVFLNVIGVCQEALDNNFETDLAILEIQKILNFYQNQESQRNTGINLKNTLPQIFSFEKKAYLLPLVENYKLSITHLNNFLDVSRGGPENFVNQNLLAIPMGQNLASKYGSAIHLALNKFIQEWKAVKNQEQKLVIPNLEILLQDIPKYITEHLKKPSEAQAHIPKAEKQLTDFYEQVLLILADFFASLQNSSVPGSLILNYYQDISVHKNRYQKLKADLQFKIKTQFQENSIHDLILEDLLDSYRHSIKNLDRIHSGMVLSVLKTDFQDLLKKGGFSIQELFKKYKLDNFLDNQTLSQNQESFQANFQSDFGSLFQNEIQYKTWNNWNNLKTVGNYLEEYRFAGMETEVDFGYEKIILDAGGQLEAHLSGKIDFLEKYIYTTIRPEKGFLVVNDFKTGKPLEKWKNSTEDEQVKAWKLENQLLYYQILCQNSNRYRGYKVNMGRLIFVEAHKNWQNSFLELNMDLEKSKTLSRLAQIVYQKIINLDFPDTDYYVQKYSKKMDSIQAFTEDLLDGKV